MDPKVIVEHLKLPPERVRLAFIYPTLPDPIPFAIAESEGPADDDDDDDDPDFRGLYTVAFERVPLSWWSGYPVPREHHRIVEEYEAARARQADAEEACAAARWNQGEAEEPPPPAPEPEPEAVPPEGKLTGRQEAFCRHYARQPVGTRAAVLAGYAEDNAAPYGSRLLKNPLVLDRIATLRQEQRIHYVVERDTMHDKLEAVFFEALGERNHAAAVAALRLQANLAGILTRAAPDPEASPDPKAEKSQGAPAKKPNKAKPAPRRKPRKAKVGRRQKPSKAKQSQ